MLSRSSHPSPSFAGSPYEEISPKLPVNGYGRMVQAIRDGGRSVGTMADGRFVEIDRTQRRIGGAEEG